MKWNSDVKAYIEFFQDGCPLHLRPERCEGCGFKGIIHRHGHYMRVVVTLCSRHTLMIYRFKCPACKKTHSLIPTFIGSNRQAIWDVEEFIVENNEAGTALAELATNFPPPAGPYSEKTFWRWNTTWKQRMSAIQPFVTKQVLDKIPNMILPVGKDQPSTSKGWLLYFWHKWKNAFSEEGTIGFFHWLYRMCQA